MSTSYYAACHNCKTKTLIGDRIPGGEICIEYPLYLALFLGHHIEHDVKIVDDENDKALDYFELKAIVL
jgi:hypothetical protein